VDYLDLTSTTQGSNTAGMYEEFYFARHEDVLTWPTIKAVPATPADHVTYDTPFIMKTGKKFAKLNTILGNAEVKWSLVGARGGKTFRNTLDVFMPENSAEKLGALSYMKNDKLVLIGRDRTKKLRVVGTELLPAMLDTLDGTTGKKAEDDPGAGNTLLFVTEDDYPPIIYTDEIPLTPAVEE